VSRKRRYTVSATAIAHVTIEIEATSRAHAIQKAKDAAPTDWKEHSPPIDHEVFLVTSVEDCEVDS